MPSKIEAADWHDIFALPDAAHKEAPPCKAEALRAARGVLPSYTCADSTVCSRIARSL
jgi:hypothetical protein